MGIRDLLNGAFGVLSVAAGQGAMQCAVRGTGTMLFYASKRPKVGAGQGVRLHLTL